MWCGRRDEEEGTANRSGDFMVELKRCVVVQWRWNASSNGNGGGAHCGHSETTITDRQAVFHAVDHQLPVNKI